MLRHNKRDYRLWIPYEYLGSAVFELVSGDVRLGQDIFDPFLGGPVPVRPGFGTEHLVPERKRNK